MSDSTTVESYLDQTLAAVPNATGDLPSVLDHGRTRQRRNRVVYAVLSTVAVFLLVAPLAFVSMRHSQPLGAEAYTETEFTFESGMTVAVDGAPVEYRGALVFKGVPAEPSFDATSLGVAHPFSERGAANLVVPSATSPLESNALQANALVYLGDIDDGQIALQQTRGQTCIFWGNGTDITGGGLCPVPSTPTIGYSADPGFPASDGGWLVWSVLPDDVAVVTVNLPDGRSWWQAPVSNTAFFAVADLGTLRAATVSAFGRDGELIVSDREVTVYGSEPRP